MKSHQWTTTQPRGLREMDPENSNKEAFTASLQRHPTFRASKLVPPEILIQIFLLSLPPVDCGQAQHRTSLALVCRLWNDIIEATPMLWSQISFIDGPSNVKRALLKSAESLIDVYGGCLPIDCPYSIVDHDICRHLLREVERHSERWRSVELPIEYLAHIFALGPTYSPFLESVKLRSTLKIIVDDGYLTLVTSACTPRLRELILDGTGFARWDIQFAPTLSHLIFENIRISSTQILTVLAASPNLTVLHLSELDNWGSDDGTPDFPFVELASLREVTVTGIRVVRDVMAKLKFPLDCKVSLQCDVYYQDPRASFLEPGLSRYRETFQQVGEIIQARVVVPASGVQVVLRYLRWEIVLGLSNGRATLDTLEWFGITANTSVAASESDLEDSPINSIPPPSNIPVSLELGSYHLQVLLQRVNPLLNLKCINRIKVGYVWSFDDYNELFSYLAEPQVPRSSATTASTTSQEPGDNGGSGPAMQNVAETWPVPGLCELAIQSSEDRVLRGAMALVKARWPPSGVGLGPNPAASVRSPATRVLARLKRIELGEEGDTSPESECRRCLPGSVEAWPKALLDLLEFLDEDVQVFWFGKRISKAGIMD
ncbi:hypothetical protein FRC05_007183 [Tulasnella sp. 425]|nr:hypothetical protein FRC05_007183 [Tulasnella sp. 425]